MKRSFENFVFIGAIVVSLGIILFKIFNDRPRNSTAIFSLNYIDLGQVRQNYQSEVHFYLTNTGDNLLHIKDVVPDCYCTVPNWSKQPILPGDSTLVTVFHKTNNIGRFQQDVKVYLNTQNSPLLLTIHGKVVTSFTEKAAEAIVN